MSFNFFAGKTVWIAAWNKWWKYFLSAINLVILVFQLWSCVCTIIYQLDWKDCLQNCGKYKWNELYLVAIVHYTKISTNLEQVNVILKFLSYHTTWHDMLLAFYKRRFPSERLFIAWKSSLKYLAAKRTHCQFLTSS